MVIIHVHIETTPATRDEFLAAASSIEKATQTEAGCVYYRFHESTAEPNNFILVETWSDRAALDAHIAQPYTSQYRELTSRLLQRHEAILYNVASSELL
jgi:quinol monooxygenase YgiN